MGLRIPIYLDNHATTKVDPRVLEVMLPYFSESYGNASSKHHEFGWVAEAAVEQARTQVATLIGAVGREVIFTSGATESVNLALKGIAEGYGPKGRHVITAATEHKAVLDTCKALARRGYRVSVVPVDNYGVVSPDDVKRAITEETLLVSIMMANNEIGTLAPLGEIGRLCREQGIVFHTDAAQAVGKVPVNVETLNVDLLSFTAHKMYGPKGVGALFVRSGQPRLKITQQIDGGGHEKGLRSGTLNVPAIVGFGSAADIARSEMEQDAGRLSVLHDKLVKGLMSEVDEISVNGHPIERLPHNANITFTHVPADRLMMEMKDIAVSSGSACSSASPEPSHVLKAIGLQDEDILASIRFGLGRFTTEEEIDYTIVRVVERVNAIRKKIRPFRAGALTTH